MQSGTKGLFLWCQQVTEGYKNVEVRNMTKSWRDGLAFCAMIHRFRPDLIDFESLSPENVWENNQLAFDVAEKELGIPALLDADDMEALLVPDKLSIMTYVSQYYNYFKRKVPSAPDTTKKIGTARTTVKRPHNQENVFKDKDIAVPSKKATLDDKCHICSKKVYLVEKVISNGGLFHRSCFKCQKCGAMLRPGAAKVTPDMKTIECQHHGDKIFKLRANIASRKNENKNQNSTPASEPSPWETKKIIAEPSPTPSPRLHRGVKQANPPAAFSHVSKPLEQPHPHMQANESARAHFFTSPAAQPSTTSAAKDVNKAAESDKEKDLKKGLISALAAVKAKDDAKKASEAQKASEPKPAANTSIPAKDTKPIVISGESEKNKPAANEPSAKTLQKESPAVKELPEKGEEKKTPVAAGGKPEKKEKSITKGITKKIGLFTKGEKSPENVKKKELKNKEKEKDKKKETVVKPSDATPTKPITVTPKPVTVTPKPVTVTPAKPKAVEIKEKELPKPVVAAAGESHKVAGEIPKGGAPKALKDRISAFEKMGDNNEQVSGEDVEMKDVGEGNVNQMGDAKVNGGEREEEGGFNPFDDDDAEDESSEAEKHEQEEQEKKEEEKKPLLKDEEDKKDVNGSVEIKEMIEENNRNSQIEDVLNPFDDDLNPFGNDDDDDDEVEMETGAKQGQKEDTQGEQIGAVTSIVTTASDSSEEVMNQTGDQKEIETIERTSEEKEMIVEKEKEDVNKVDNKQEVDKGRERVEVDLNKEADKDVESKDKKPKNISKEKKHKEKGNSDYDETLNPFASNDDEDDEGSSDSDSDSDSSLGPNNPFAADNVGGGDYDESLNPFGEDDDEEEEAYNVNPFTGSPIEKRAPVSFDRGSQRSTGPKVKPPRPPPPKITPTKQSPSPYSVKTRQQILQEFQRERQTLQKKKRKAPAAPGTPSSDADSVESTPTKPEGNITAPPRTRKPKRAPPPPPGQSPILNGKVPGGEGLPVDVSRLRDTPTSTPEGSPPVTPKRPSRAQSKRKAPAPPPQKRDVAKYHVRPEEIRQELKEIEVKTKELEQKGIDLENKLRQDMQDDGLEDCEELLMEWFEVVNEKNQLLRKEGELVAQEQIQQLEIEHAEVEYEMRCLMSKQEHEKTDADAKKEEELLDLLVEVVAQRSQIVDRLEEDRIREQKEDEDIKSMMQKKGHLLDVPESWGLDRDSVEQKKEKKKKKKKKKEKKEKKAAEEKEKKAEEKEKKAEEKEKKAEEKEKKAAEEKEKTTPEEKEADDEKKPSKKAHKEKKTAKEKDK